MPVEVGSSALRFEVPARLRPAKTELDRLLRDYEGLSSLRILERLSSGPGSFQVTRFREQAPSSRAYRILDASDASLVGTEGIAIGGERWDRAPGGAWVASPQSQRRVPSAYWTARARNAYFTASDEITFYDPTFPGWFRLRFDPATGHVRTLRMVAAAHFMDHVYSGFDRPLSISPPP